MRRRGPVKRNHPLYCTDWKSADCYCVWRINDDNLQKENLPARFITDVNQTTGTKRPKVFSSVRDIQGQTISCWNFTWKRASIFSKKWKFLFRVDSFGENILTLLLNDGAHDESGLEKRKKCLLWLKDNKDEALGKIISTKNCSGSNAMSLVGSFDWGSNEEKDQMISWLLSKGANINHMNQIEAEAYLDR